MSQQPNYRQLMQSALKEIQTLRTRVNELDRPAEPIAIVGIGCRFPGQADSPAAFWDMLRKGTDGITPVPDERWDADRLHDASGETSGSIRSREGGFIAQPYDFDPHFFGISPREAKSLDPQQRLLLEVAWESLEHAAIDPQGLVGSQTGVYLGICLHDYCDELIKRPPEDIDAYLATGNLFSTAAGRLSYLLGLQGPALSVDTACSSSLVAVHLALQGLRNNDCSMAIVGGVNMLLSPTFSINFSQAQMLAPDGRCKTFDESANGYVRSEGCGVVLLKRLSDAVADGDNILTLIHGSAVNQDGKTSGLTVPNGPAQRAVIEAALADAHIAPEQVSYIEAHGTGTALGDPIELGALSEAFSTADCLHVGSVKSNIGHLEGAAGIAGVIKVALALQAEQLPANLHFSTPTPRIDWHGTPISVPTDLLPWRGTDRFAGVSSFGFSGTNAHVILGAAPVTQPATPTETRDWHALTLSAATLPALRDLAGQYVEWLDMPEQASLADLCTTAAVGRAQLAERLVCVADSAETLQAQLNAFINQKEAVGVSHASVQGRVKVAFLFTGQGAQYVGMAQTLYQSNATFRQHIDDCATHLDPELDTPLRRLLFESDSATLAQTRYTQPVLFAIEYALAQLWIDWGVTPTALIGHSIGEYAAACVAGVFSLADACRLVVARGRLMQALPQGGGMLAINAPADAVRSLIAAQHGVVSIAAINSPVDTVIAGKTHVLDTISAECTAQSIRNKHLSVSHAFHSPLMAPMCDAFRQVAQSVSYRKPSYRLVSNVTGQVADESILQADYWVNHVLAAVDFNAGLNQTLTLGCDILLEVGPQPVLLAMAQKGGAALNERIRSIASLQPKLDDWQQMSTALGQLWLAGVPLKWQQIQAAYGRRISGLPTYRFQRKHYRIVVPAQTSSPAFSAETMLRSLLDSNTFTPEEHALLPKLISAIETALKPDSSELPIYKLAWQEQDLWPPAPRATQQQWLLIAPDAATAEPLRAAFVKAGHSVHLAYLSQFAAEGTENCATFLAEAARDGQIDGMLVFPGAAMPAITQVSDWFAAAAQVCLTTCQLSAQLALAAPQAKLWVVTEQAIASVAQSAVCNPQQSLLWGLGRVVALESPSIWGGLIDVDELVSVDTIVSSILASDDEDQLLLRGNSRYVARLTEHAAGQKTLAIRPDGCYLITGGLGALGLRTAEWFATEGARSMVLVGRRGITTAAARTKVDALRAKNVDVQIICADISQADDVQTLFEQIGQLPNQLRGIIHAAGSTQASELGNISAELLSTTLKPKVLGTWLLHQHAPQDTLDFFINYSSISAIWGSSEQAAYAAANAFQDAFAAHVRPTVPMLSVNWGPWRGGGLADNALTKLLAQIGIEPLSTAQNFDLLSRLQPEQASIVVQADWDQLAAVFNAKRPRPFLENLVTQLSAPAKPAADLPALLEAMPAAQRERYLQQQVRHEAAFVLSLAPSDMPNISTGFNDMGVDSLMAIEIKRRIENRIGQALSATLLFDYPNVITLTKHILSVLTPMQSAARSNDNADTVRSLDVINTTVDGASTDDELSAELAALESLL